MAYFERHLVQWLKRGLVNVIFYSEIYTVFQLVPGVAHQHQQFVIYMFTKQGCANEQKLGN